MSILPWKPRYTPLADVFSSFFLLGQDGLDNVCELQRGNCVATTPGLSWRSSSSSPPFPRILRWWWWWPSPTHSNLYWLFPPVSLPKNHSEQRWKCAPLLPWVSPDFLRMVVLWGGQNFATLSLLLLSTTFTIGRLHCATCESHGLYLLLPKKDRSLRRPTAPSEKRSSTTPQPTPSFNPIQIPFPSVPPNNFEFSSIL